MVGELYVIEDGEPVKVGDVVRFDVVDTSPWRTDLPAPRTWCWVTDGKNVWPAYHDGKTWTNGDTWDDTTEQRVTGWIAIYPPGTVVRPLV